MSKSASHVAKIRPPVNATHCAWRASARPKPTSATLERCSDLRYKAPRCVCIAQVPSHTFHTFVAVLQTSDELHGCTVRGASNTPTRLTAFARLLLADATSRFAKGEAMCAPRNSVRFRKRAWPLMQTALVFDIWSWSTHALYGYLSSAASSATFIDRTSGEEGRTFLSDHPL